MGHGWLAQTSAPASLLRRDRKPVCVIHIVIIMAAWPKISRPPDDDDGDGDDDDDDDGDDDNDEGRVFKSNPAVSRLLLNSVWIVFSNPKMKMLS